MNDVLRTEFFRLLAGCSQEVTNKEMQKAYGDLVKHIEAVSISNDMPTVFRILNHTRIEIAALETLYRYEQEKKCA